MRWRRANEQASGTPSPNRFSAHLSGAASLTISGRTEWNRLSGIAGEAFDGTAWSGLALWSDASTQGLSFVRPGGDILAGTYRASSAPLNGWSVAGDVMIAVYTRQVGSRVYTYPVDSGEVVVARSHDHYSGQFVVYASRYTALEDAAKPRANEFVIVKPVDSGIAPVAIVGEFEIRR